MMQEVAEAYAGVSEQHAPRRPDIWGQLTPLFGMDRQAGGPASELIE
jgi:hypothetical protein